MFDKYQLGGNLDIFLTTLVSLVHNLHHTKESNLFRYIERPIHENESKINKSNTISYITKYLPSER
jgi:hypothetical protein